MCYPNKSEFSETQTTFARKGIRSHTLIDDPLPEGITVFLVIFRNATMTNTISITLQMGETYIPSIIKSVPHKSELVEFLTTLSYQIILVRPL